MNCLPLEVTMSSTRFMLPSGVRGGRGSSFSFDCADAGIAIMLTQNRTARNREKSLVFIIGILRILCDGCRSAGNVLRDCAVGESLSQCLEQHGQLVRG